MRDGRAVSQFNSILIWKRLTTTPVAWYSEIVEKLLTGHYERLGLEFDVLRLIVSGRVESRLLYTYPVSSYKEQRTSF